MVVVVGGAVMVVVVGGAVMVVVVGGATALGGRLNEVVGAAVVGADDAAVESTGTGGFGDNAPPAMVTTNAAPSVSAAVLRVRILAHFIRPRTSAISATTNPTRPTKIRNPPTESPDFDVPPCREMRTPKGDECQPRQLGELRTRCRNRRFEPSAVTRSRLTPGTPPLWDASPSSHPTIPHAGWE